MDNALNKFALSILAFAVSGCATKSVPSNFIYETSLRGEQGFVGRAGRLDAASSLLSAGVVVDPAAALKTALPDAKIDVKRWGLKYFGSNWSRYQIVLDANIQQGDAKTKCRMKSPETPVGASTLPELRANDGADLQNQLSALVTACAAKTG